MNQLKKSLTARTLLVSAVVAAILAAGFGLLLVTIGALRDAGRSALRAQQAVTVGTELERSVIALESGLRGFVATGADRELAPYLEAQESYQEQVAQLRDLARGDVQLRDDVAAVELGISGFIDFWAAPLIDTTRDRPAVARSLLDDDRGRERIRTVQSQLQSMFTRARASAATKETRADNRAQLAVALGIVGIVLVGVTAAGAGLLLRGGVLRPIRRVASASESLAAGDWTARVPDERRDELGDLARAFNTMAESLERHQAELAERATQLERSNRELEDYASVTAHDLQGPLVTMSMYAGLLAQRLEGEDRALAQHIRDNTASMRRLVRDLLGYARLDRTPARTGRTALDEVLQRALDSLAGPLQAAGAAVETGPLPVVEGDPDRLQQLLQNLLTNAVKFFEPGTTPHVEVRGSVALDGVAHVTVRDHGIGFKPGQAEVIFRPFQRLHSPDKFEGSGIGLAVCAKIVDQHAGRIWAEGSPGEGATFHFTLPLATAADPVDPKPDATLVGAGGLPT